MRAAYLLNRVEHAALTRELHPDLLEKTACLRDMTFWDEKNFKKIEELTLVVEELLSQTQ